MLHLHVQHPEGQPAAVKIVYPANFSYSTSMCSTLTGTLTGSLRLWKLSILPILHVIS
jgi:hypothetical protein